MDTAARCGDIGLASADGAIIGLAAGDSESGRLGLVGFGHEIGEPPSGTGLFDLLPDDAGKAGRLNLLTPRHSGPARVAVVGLGDPEALTTETVRKAVAKAVVALRDAGARHVTCQPLGLRPAGEPGALPPRLIGEAIAEGAALADYRFRAYKTDDDEPPSVASLTVLSLDEAAVAPLGDGLAAGAAKAAGACWCRDLTNTPARDLTPHVLAEEAASMASHHGLTCTVHGEDWLEAEGFGLLLGVNAGSDAPPALIILEHRGGEGTPVGLVGKGVCFDSGGLSLKGGDSMMGMKNDMGGAAAVLGTMRAIAELALPINVTAIIPAVQNLVSAGATRPGDIHTSYSGKTVEVLNTDAEGRLILADALAYATATLGLSPVLDIATLTGACMRAVGPVFAGLLTPCDDLRDALLVAAAEAGEKFWPLPLDEEFGEMMRSPIADLRNISLVDGGGASSAAMFLREFVGETPWIHLDVAGRMSTTTAKEYIPPGGTGFAVRTLVNWLRARCA